VLLCRQVGDLKTKFEQEKSRISETTTEGREQIEPPSMTDMPVNNINGQMELKTMVDAIAAASQREAEAHETAIILSRENEELRVKIRALLEDNSKLIELYEQATSENNRKSEEEAALKRVIEDLQHQLMEVNEENDKLMSLYERAMQEKDDLKRLYESAMQEKDDLKRLYERAMQEKDDLERTLSCSGHERVETKGELDCVEKLVEVDEGERDLGVGTVSDEAQDIDDNRYDDKPTISGSDLCLESEGQEEEKLVKEDNEIDILVSTKKDTEVSNLKEAKLSMELNCAKEKLERVDEQILDAVRTLGCAENEVVQVDELSREIQVIEHDIQVKHQQFKSLNLELNEAHNRRTLADKKLSALKYSLSNFMKHGSFSYFELREAKARAAVKELASQIERKKGELAALQASKQGLENAVKKNQESEAELAKNIAGIKSKLEEENRKREGEKVLFAIDNTQSVDSSVKSWQFSGKAFDLLKLEEEKTKLQAEMKHSQEKFGVIRKELGNLNKKVANVESQIQAIGLEIQQGLRSTKEKELSLQRAMNEKEMFSEFRDNGMLEMEHLIINLQQCVFEYDLKEAETKILGEELQMDFLKAEDLQTAMVIAANSNFLSSMSCVGTFEKVEEQMKNLRVSIQQTKLLLEGISHAT
jgi:kinesin family protein 15